MLAQTGEQTCQETKPGSQATSKPARNPARDPQPPNRPAKPVINMQSTTPASPQPIKHSFTPSFPYRDLASFALQLNFFPPVNGVLNPTVSDDRFGRHIAFRSMCSVSRKLDLGSTYGCTFLMFFVFANRHPVACPLLWRTACSLDGWGLPGGLLASLACWLVGCVGLLSTQA